MPNKMIRTNDEWFEWCMKKGTSGDMVFSIINDWAIDRELGINALAEWFLGENHKVPYENLLREYNNREEETPC